MFVQTMTTTVGQDQLLYAVHMNDRSTNQLNCHSGLGRDHADTCICSQLIFAPLASHVNKEGLGCQINSQCVNKGVSPC